MACICMFLFKRESRNAMNNAAKKGIFRENYLIAFGMKLPHMDTVAIIMEKCAPEQIEIIKHKMLQCLINKKVFRKFLFENRYVVAVDGTGVGSYGYEPWEGCPYKQFKSKKVWYAPVLEAKLVCCNGFSISLCTQWVVNSGNFSKQNCELKAFEALSAKIKKQFPRLPIIIAADGLYPNANVFNTCKKNGWKYVITLKEGNLKTFWEHINWELRVSKDKPHERTLFNKPGYKMKHTCRFINGQPYKELMLNWIECIEEIKKKGKTDSTRFVHVTNIEATRENIFILCMYARKRWNIENEGFADQKNRGYTLEHKYSRKSLWARQNYYQCLQIAHLINQLVEKSSKFIALLSPKDTIKSYWEYLMAFIAFYFFSILISSVLI